MIQSAPPAWGAPDLRVRLIQQERFSILSAAGRTGGECPSSTGSTATARGVAEANPRLDPELRRAGDEIPCARYEPHILDSRVGRSQPPIEHRWDQV
jgi:hypothetical protein